MHRRERQKETAGRGLNGGRETRRVEVKRTSVPTGAVTRGRGWAERRTSGHETGVSATPSGFLGDRELAG